MLVLASFFFDAVAEPCNMTIGLSFSVMWRVGEGGALDLSFFSEVIPLFPRESPGPIANVSFFSFPS